MTPSWRTSGARAARSHRRAGRTSEWTAASPCRGRRGRPARRDARRRAGVSPRPRGARDDVHQAQRIQLEELADELELHLRGELDFVEEAHNTELIRTLMERFETLVVPRVIHPYVTERALVLELIDGRRVEAGHGLDPERAALLAREFFRAYVFQVVVEGVYHADPHLGNVLLTDDGRLALLDSACWAGSTRTREQAWRCCCSRSPRTGRTTSPTSSSRSRSPRPAPTRRASRRTPVAISPASRTVRSRPLRPGRPRRPPAVGDPSRHQAAAVLRSGRQDAGVVRRSGSVAGGQALRARPLVRGVVTCRYAAAPAQARFETLRPEQRRGPEAKTSAQR